MPDVAFTEPSAQVVREFLDAMERRDLLAATGCLAPGFRMTFPGNCIFVTLDELVNWSKQRYRHISKRYQRVDVMHEHAGTVVYCSGTLHGVWLDGREFDDIRFIDRFVVANGKLVEQAVWNDMGEILGDNTA